MFILVLALIGCGLFPTPLPVERAAPTYAFTQEWHGTPPVESALSCNTLDNASTDCRWVPTNFGGAFECLCHTK
jgi:hypothetical protein